MAKGAHLTSVLAAIAVSLVSAAAFAQSTTTQPSASPAPRVSALGPTTRQAKMFANKQSDLPPSPEALFAAVPTDVAQWLMDWETHEVSGRGATDDELHSLHEMLLADKVDPIALCGLLRLVDFLDGHDATMHIYRVVTDQSAAALDKCPSAAQAQPLIAAMWPMHDVFNDMQAHDVDKQLVGALRKWETYGSPSSQKTNYIYGEMLYEAGDYDNAVEVYQNLVKERTAATQPSEYINRPLDWDLALCLAGAGRFAEAAAHYEAAAQDHGPYSRSAAMAVPVMLYRAGKKQEAIAKFKDVCATYQLSPQEIDQLAQSMQ